MIIIFIYKTYFLLQAFAERGCRTISLYSFFVGARGGDVAVVIRLNIGSGDLYIGVGWTWCGIGEKKRLYFIFFAAPSIYTL